MAVFAYIAHAEADASSPVRGTIAADSPRQARDQLRAQGLYIRDIAEQAPGRRGLLDRVMTARQAGKVTGLLLELSTLLSAGIPLLDCLDTVTRQHAGSLRRSIMLLRDHVAGGGTLAQAMAREPALFDELSVNMIEVGENAGTLDRVMAQLVEFRRRSSGLKNRVASAMIYPAIVLGTGLILSLFMMTYVMPRLFTVLAQSGKELPLATMIVKSISDFLLQYWWLMLLLFGALCTSVMVLMRAESTQRRWHRFQLRLPILGDLIRKQAIARVSMVMSALLNSGIVFVRAVQIAQRTTHNLGPRDALSACEHAVIAGRDISVALERTGAFPPLVVQIFAVGQASGRLEQMLDSLSIDYDKQVELATTRLTALLEPVMMILLAIAVGFIAFATILPILEAGNVL